MDRMLKSLAFVLFGLLCLPAHSQTVASCPTATPGSTWNAATNWLPCSNLTYIAQPIPATAIINDMRCTAPGTCVTTWQSPSGVLPTDQVWAKTAAAPTGTWVKAWTLTFAAAPPPPAPTYPAQAVVSWTAVTTDINGAPLTTPVTYNLYRGTCGGTLTKLTSVSGLTYTDPAGGATPVSYGYAVTAVSAGLESAETKGGCETIAAPAVKPAAVATVTVR